MIPLDFITEWRRYAPWTQDEQVEQDLIISRAEFEANLEEKVVDRSFALDMVPLLAPDVEWDFDEAVRYVREELVLPFPGSRWKGRDGKGWSLS